MLSYSAVPFFAMPKGMVLPPVEMTGKLLVTTSHTLSPSSSDSSLIVMTADAVDAIGFGDGPLLRENGCWAAISSVAFGGPLLATVESKSGLIDGRDWHIVAMHVVELDVARLVKFLALALDAIAFGCGLGDSQATHLVAL